MALKGGSAARYDVIVLGLGAMGSATAYHLARRGLRVLGVEQFDIPHDLGSSHGINRIIRLAYWEHPAYVPLLRRAYALWRALEHEADERLLLITGGIDAGRPQSATVTGALRACAEHAIEHEVLDSQALSRRFPGYCLPSDIVGVYQPDAGFLLSERCIVAHVRAAQTQGAEIHARERALSWRAGAGGVEVDTEYGRYAADRLVITAGAWAGALVEPLRHLAQPERQVLLWTQPRRPDSFHLGRFPVFNAELPEGRFYGFPIYGIPGFKIGKYHHLRQHADPDDLDRRIHAEDKEVLREAVRLYFPDADGPTMTLKACMFTNAPDSHFILDRHPDHAQVSFAAGFSGHGFKFSSVIGELMADLSLEGGSRFDTSLFRYDRFA